MTERFEVKLRKAVHVFCAGHFITLTDELCEPVHGHNWTVGVDVAGEPDGHGMVIDFIALRDALTAIVSRLDHRMLLPTRNPRLTVATERGPFGGEEVTVRFADRRWVFPAEECVLLPRAATLRVEVDECLGQSAVWERTDE